MSYLTEKKQLTVEDVIEYLTDVGEDKDLGVYPSPEDVAEAITELRAGSPQKAISVMENLLEDIDDANATDEPDEMAIELNRMILFLKGQKV